MVPGVLSMSGWMVLSSLALLPAIRTDGKPGVIGWWQATGRSCCDGMKRDGAGDGPELQFKQKKCHAVVSGGPPALLLHTRPSDLIHFLDANHISLLRLRGGLDRVHLHEDLDDGEILFGFPALQKLTGKRVLQTKPAREFRSFMAMSFLLHETSNTRQSSFLGSLRMILYSL